MLVDLDDFYDGQHRLDLLYRLKDANPAFRATLFAVPGLCTEEFLDTLPTWLQLAVHGWEHPDPYECSEWTAEQMENLLDWPLVRTHFCRGFKAPGWQISQACYGVLMDHGYWVADQPYNDFRRPAGIRCHLLSPDAGPQGENEHWHGHIQDVCGNGLEETFDLLLERVRAATHFEWISERVTRWKPLVEA